MQDEEPAPLDPCESHACRAGECRPDSSLAAGYRCDCRPGYSGAQCQTRASRSRKRGRSFGGSKQRAGAGKRCRKEKYRDYYVQPDGCRSVKPYKVQTTHNN